MTELLRVRTNAVTGSVPNSYDGIKEGLDGGILDFIQTARHDAGLYIDDEGMLKRLALNVPASMFSARPIYGPVVLCAARPDNEGNTLPPNKDDVVAMELLCHLWRHVIQEAQRQGQDLRVYAEPATIPPPEVISFATEEEFMRYLEGKET